MGDNKFYAFCGSLAAGDTTVCHLWRRHQNYTKDGSQITDDPS